MFSTILKNDKLCVVDVGASGGIHERWLRFDSNIKAILFEPDPREYENLSSKVPNSHFVLNSALSEKNEEVEFNLCRKQQVSSVYKPNMNTLNKFPEIERFEIVKKIKIKADTLDNQLEKNRIWNVDFIKIDAEGYELSILKGAQNALKQAIGLEIEVCFLPIRENQPLFHDINKFLLSQNFELFDLKRNYWRRTAHPCYRDNRKGQMIHGDALYFRVPEDLIENGPVDQNRVVQAICVYLAYGYLDLAYKLYELGIEKKLLMGSIAKGVKKSLEQELKRKRFLLPDFMGKTFIHQLLGRFTNLFSSTTWYAGGDEHLGNN